MKRIRKVILIITQVIIAVIVTCIFATPFLIAILATQGFWWNTIALLVIFVIMNLLLPIAKILFVKAGVLFSRLIGLKDEDFKNGWWR